MILKECIDIQDDKLTRGIGPVVKIMNLIDGSSDEEIIVDCSSIRFVSPVFIISFILCLYSSKKRLRVINKTPYLDIIHFLDTLKPDKFSKAEFCTLLRKYERKTYIPVINFPALANRSSDKDAILSAIENILCLQLGIKHNVLNGLGEMVDNITEHSESERGYIFAQSWGCVKTDASSFLFAKPRLSQARALLFPKDFVPLGILSKLWQSYIFVLTIPTKWFFFLKESMKILRTMLLSALSMR